MPPEALQPMILSWSFLIGSRCKLGLSERGTSVWIIWCLYAMLGFPAGSVVKNPPVNAGDMGSVPELGRCPGKGNGNPHQYPCLGNSMDRGAWQTRVHGVAKSQPQLSTHKSKKKGGLDFKRIHTCYSLRWDPSNDTLWSLPEGSTQRRLNTQL